MCVCVCVCVCVRACVRVCVCVCRRKRSLLTHLVKKGPVRVSMTPPLPLRTVTAPSSHFRLQSPLVRGLCVLVI